MTTQYADVNGIRVVSGSITIPYYGTWSGDLLLATSAPISGPLTLTLGGLVLHGTAVRTAPFAASRQLRLVGGAGGWRTSIPSRAYYAAGGVPLRMVLTDAATECGERIVVANDMVIGDHLTRPVGPASDVLRELVSQWWIDNDGITQVSASRPSVPIASDYQVIEWDAGRGLAKIATESVQDWMPGNTFQSPAMTIAPAIGTTFIRADANGTWRVEVLTIGAQAA